MNPEHGVFLDTLFPSPADLPGIPTALFPHLLRGVRGELAPLATLLHRLGDPHLGLRVVLVGGTNGKGSTTSFLADLCRASGWKTGLFQSPSPSTFAEHMFLNGQPPSPRVLDVLAGECLPHVTEPLTSFEWATALALRWFYLEGAEVVVMEVGMGGRDDATNLTQPCLSIITNVDLDHTRVLGATVEEITAVKMGICRPGIPLLTASRGDVVAQMEVEARHLRSPFRVLGRDFFGEGTWRDACFRQGSRWLGPVTLGLRGDHQVANAALAVAAAWELGLDLTAEVGGVLASTWLPGRLEYLEGPGVWLDGAHNPAGARILAEALRREVGPRIHVVLGAYRDKDVGGMGEALAGIAADFTAVGISTPRGLSAPEVVAHLEGRVGDVPVGQASSVDEALERIRDQLPVVITGSLSWIQHTRRLVKGDR